MKVSKTNSPVFKSGLSYNIYKELKNANVKQLEEEFKSVGVDADFLNSKTLSGCATYVCNILQEISGKYRLPLDGLPAAIRVYKLNSLVDDVADDCFNAEGFCISNSKKVLKDEPAFFIGSLFYNKPIVDSPIICDMNNFLTHMGNYNSTSHFLRLIMHEWFHSIHLDLILKKFGYEGSESILNDAYIKQRPCGLKKIDEIENENIDPATRTYIEKQFGRYSVLSGSWMEVFAEVMTKITAQSLDKKLNVIRNPLDNLPKDMPKFIKNFIDEMLNI